MGLCCKSACKKCGTASRREGDAGQGTCRLWIKRESAQLQNVSAKSLCADLVNFSAFDHSVQEVQELNLLSTHETELEQASDLDDIFILLGTEFSNFDIYDNEWLVHRHPVTDDDGCIFRLHF